MSKTRGRGLTKFSLSINYLKSPRNGFLTLKDIEKVIFQTSTCSACHRQKKFRAEGYYRFMLVVLTLMRRKRAGFGPMSSSMNTLMYRVQLAFLVCIFFLSTVYILSYDDT